MSSNEEDKESSVVSLDLSQGTLNQLLLANKQWVRNLGSTVLCCQDRPGCPVSCKTELKQNLKRKAGEPTLPKVVQTDNLITIVYSNTPQGLHKLRWRGLYYNRGRDSVYWILMVAILIGTYIGTYLALWVHPVPFTITDKASITYLHVA